MSFELNYAMGYTTTIFSPFIAKLAEPIPTIYLSALACLVLMLTPLMGKYFKSEAPEGQLPGQRLNESIHQSIVDLFHHSFAKDNHTSIELIEKHLNINKWKMAPKDHLEELSNESESDN